MVAEPDDRVAPMQSSGQVQERGPARFGSVLAGIIHQVGEDLLDAGEVHLEAEAGLGGGLGEAGDHPLQEVRQGHALEVYVALPASTRTAAAQPERGAPP